ncbi:MAG: tetratricopeptide repeat protein [Xanthobacteraceae bacterium]
MSTAHDERRLRAAHALRSSGKLHEAADLYRTLVKSDPDNFQALHFLGVAEAGKGDFAQAKIHMARSLALEPLNIQFVENYATILFQGGDYGAALDTCESGLKRDGNSATLLYVSALSHYRLGRFPEALGQFAKLLKLQPRHIAALNERAAAFAALKQYDAALTSIDQAITIEPKFAEAHLNKAILCGQMKRYADAVAAYDKALALRPNLADAWLGRGDNCYALRRFDDALHSYGKVLALNASVVPAWFGRGKVFYDNKQFEEALAAFDKTVAAKPDFADAWLCRGNALFALRRLDEALVAYDTALALQPELPEAWLGRANVLGECKSYDQSFVAYDRALALRPDLAEALLGRGNISRELGRIEDSLADYERAVSLKPDLSGAWLGCGNVFCELKRYDDALAAYDQASASNADLADAWLGRGNVFERLHRHADALAAYGQALALKPDYPEALLGRGNVFDAVRHFDDALAAYDRALELRPDYAKAWFGRGNMYSEFRRFDDALVAYDRALELKPDLAEAWFGRGRTYSRMDRDVDAIAAHDRALALKPDFPEALFGRAVSYLEINRDRESLADLDKALSLRPDFEGAITFRIFVLEFAQGVGIEEQQEARRYWWRQVGAKLASQSKLQHNNSRDPDRRIRLGYVSGDFRFHSAALAFRPMLANHDKSRFDVTCYSTSNTEDDFTEHFRASADRWRNVVQLSDEEFCEQVQADEIDILIDLSGYTTGDRLAAFARKPAPIQVSAGATGTGLPTIDYLLSHPVICPPAIRPLFAETIVDLPTVMTIVPLPEGYGPTDPPMLTNGYVTFGVFNRATKVSDDVLALWARILHAVPCSRILMKHYGFDDEQTRKRMVMKFESLGIAADRIAFLGKSTRGDHLAAFKDVDISLDPFPHNGGISTLESLQMGVPVVAMLGNAITSRAAGAILASVELDDWVSDNADGYLAIAAKFAAMPEHLKAMRYEIPARLLNNPAGNPQLFTRALERAYRKMWVEYCRPAG